MSNGLNIDNNRVGLATKSIFGIIKLISTVIQSASGAHKLMNAVTELPCSHFILTITDSILTVIELIPAIVKSVPDITKIISKIIYQQQTVLIVTSLKHATHRLVDWRRCCGSRANVHHGAGIWPRLSCSYQSKLANRYISCLQSQLSAFFFRTWG